MSHPELIFYARSTLLEGPVWNSAKCLVYCVSIDQNMVYEVNPDTHEIKSFPTDGPVGCVLVEDSGKLISAEKSGLYRINTSSGEREYLLQIECNQSLRYNDGIFDPRGRLLVGSKTVADDVESYGSLYSYDGEKTTKLISPTGISNGLAFRADGAYLYFIDTPTKKVAGYHYDLENGTIEFDRYVIEISGEGFPDGMCIDGEGYLWVAEWEGGQVCRWNPDTGEKIKSIKMPCKRVTSCCLGGKNKEMLFVTTAKSDGDDVSSAGGLYRIELV